MAGRDGVALARGPPSPPIRTTVLNKLMTWSIAVRINIPRRWILHSTCLFEKH
ncbi:uncharacterized protein CANTADRAFT_26947 [Suhomyces tanzawaensis NRRL Y-17324]|uniref:Uncharacterized protein n=1 Tax=Suhomyces tanzawaensis NRRL Y-17324 TaxID=984487 RepID=A0A1E4SER7_9ASCO|nr:uncharacterized protein CANTADRAFT_26947 [Suhomyces tanzawaensis NRRL Y-17324]ODV77970.1 hypothetical protein CANTADRAFT_26947 [Suhomyces tanzawaensis NRRL Y-17324]